MTAVGIALLALSSLSNIAGARLVPGRLKILIPSIGWLLCNIILSHGPFVWYAVSLSIHGVFGSLLFLAYGVTNDHVSRMAIFPCLVTAIAGGLGPIIPPLGVWPSVCIILIQLKSLVGGIVMLACYPGTLMQILEHQEIRRRRFRSAIQNSKKDNTVEMLLAKAPEAGGVICVATIKQTYKTNRWVVYCGGNAECLENTISEVSAIGNGLKANMMLFNHRGIGRSSGYLSCLDDLVKDAVVAVQFLIERENIADGKSILFFGHSIGGAVAAQVVSQCCPMASLVVDRSFSSLADAAVAHSLFTPRVTRAVFPLLVGNLDTLSAWNCIEHDRKRILYVSGDEIIPYKVASIARLAQFQAGGKDFSKVLQLQGTPSSLHNSSLNAFENYADVLASMEQIFAG